MRAERGDGTVVDYNELLEANRRAWRAQHGAATQILSDRIRTAPPEEMISVALAYELPELDALRKLPREDRIPAIAAAITSRSQPIGAWLAELGFVESRRARLMPAFFGAMQARALAGVVHDGRVVLAELDVPVVPAKGRGEYAEYDAHSLHAIDETWNTCSTCGSGNYGQEVPVSMIEWCAADESGAIDRGIYDDHLAFVELTPFNASDHVGYTQPPHECESSEDCEDAEGCDEGVLACIDGRCISKHASEVASIIAATNGAFGPVPHGAAKVRLFMANGVKPNTVSNYELSYESAIWDNEPARLVNETHAGINEGGNFRVADYYAYTYDVQPIQAAGNDFMDVACRYSANAIRVGATKHDGTWAPYSYENVSGTDREEPDITAFGGYIEQGSGGTRVIGFFSNTDWTGGDPGPGQEGTSYSAPVVTNMLAHMRADCPGVEDIVYPNVMRAAVRTAGWAGNPDGALYETPSSTDGKDGGGWVDATALDWFCHPGAEEEVDGFAGIIDVDLEGGSAPRGEGSDYEPDFDTMSIGVRPLDYNTPAQDGGRKEYDISAEFELDAGGRVRATISWYACTLASDGLNASPVHDLDLFLLRMDPVNGNIYVVGSQSFDDNNEGFDFEVPDAGTYKLVVSRIDEQAVVCGSSAIPLGAVYLWGNW